MLNIELKKNNINNKTIKKQSLCLDSQDLNYDDIIQKFMDNIDNFIILDIIDQLQEKKQELLFYTFIVKNDDNSKEYILDHIIDMRDVYKDALLFIRKNNYRYFEALENDEFYDFIEHLHINLKLQLLLSINLYKIL